MASVHRTAGRVGGLTSWANTADRTARTDPARRRSPGSVDYWLGQLDPERFADATDEQKLAAAEAARKAHFARLALRSAQARRRRAKGGGRDAA
jgi:hypothetical protein